MGLEQGHLAANLRTFSAGASWSSSHRFTGSPQRNPPSEPSLRSTRWHGTNSAAALRAHAAAAARTAAGRPAFAAYSV